MEKSNWNVSPMCDWAISLVNWWAKVIEKLDPVIKTQQTVIHFCQTLNTKWSSRWVDRKSHIYTRHNTTSYFRPGIIPFFSEWNLFRGFILRIDTLSQNYPPMGAVWLSIIQVPQSYYFATHVYMSNLCKGVLPHYKKPPDRNEVMSRSRAYSRCDLQV